MPRNNSSARKRERQETARRLPERISERRAQQQRDRDNELLQARITVQQEASSIVGREAMRLDIPEWELQRTHFCGKPESCPMPAKICQAASGISSARP